ncbi:MAG: putative DNA modification/repair radical SAM protein [Acetanaerobacterium sp.]
MDVFGKLKILTDSAKYDVACTSSGVDRGAQPGGIGNAMACGICHSFAGDGRCISLLKVLLSNACIYDCQYCVNRRSNDVPRTTFTPRELADLTISFYRRNYIEGLFLSSGVVKNPDYTCEQMTEVLRLLREEYRFGGYIHAKAIPGADSALLARMGLLADRMSVNIELPSQQSLTLLAPDKSKQSILKPMGYLTGRIRENASDLVQYRRAPRFVPAGQSTQMIIGATPDTDYQILNLSEGLYKRYGLKRVFFSAYMPVSNNPLLPALNTKPPLLREHRLYQADWLLRFYGFKAKELLDEAHQHFNPYIDPKCNWALNHMEQFPVEVNRAPYELLLRVPGIGVNSAQRILTARRVGSLDFAALKKIGVVLKRAQYFLLCRGRVAEGLKITPDGALRALMSDRALAMYRSNVPYAYETEQLSLFAKPQPFAPQAIDLSGVAPPIFRKEELLKCLTAQI